MKTKKGGKEERKKERKEEEERECIRMENPARDFLITFSFRSTSCLLHPPSSLTLSFSLFLSITLTLSLFSRNCLSQEKMTFFLHHEKSKSSCLQNLIFDTFDTSSYNEKKFEESNIEREGGERKKYKGNYRGRESERRERARGR